MYQPQPDDFLDIFLSQHAEERMWLRFPHLHLKEGITVWLTYNESLKAEPTWALKIHGGYLLGTVEQAKRGSRYIQGVFVIRTALFEWQYRRSCFQPKKAIPIYLRRVNSQIQNKLKQGKFQ